MCGAAERTVKTTRKSRAPREARPKRKRSRAAGHGEGGALFARGSFTAHSRSARLKKRASVAAAATATSSSAAAWAQGRPYSGNNASSRFQTAIGHAKTFSTPPKGAFALEDLLEKIKMYILSTKKRKQVSPMVRK